MDEEHKEHSTEHHTEHHVEHHLQKKKKLNGYKIATVVLAVLLITSVVFLFRGTSFSGMSTTHVEQKVNDYLKSDPRVSGATVSGLELESGSGVYKGVVSIQGQEIPVFISKDAKYLFSGALVLEQTETTETTTEETTTEVTKTDKPVVDVFVMSHCPYGTQIEKGIIPVVELLKDKIDFNIRFVYYAMHGEKEVYEELNQYCIQKEQNDKYLTYLKCFLQAGDGASCLETAGIDTTKLKTCTDAADIEFQITENFNDQASWLSGQFPLFNINKDLNDNYGVAGSPTLVINGAEASSGRDSASLLKTICNAFTTAPSECTQTLSSTSPSAGFGYEEGSNTEATCG